jgi:hypothetical protein
MDNLLMYILACLVASVLGVISVAAVFAIGWLLNRYLRAPIEATFAIAGLVGIMLGVTGQFLRYKALMVASLLLWGWMVIPTILLPLLLLWQLWQLVAWLLPHRRRRTDSDVNAGGRSL